MARKFGKKKEISLNPLSYNIGVAGISGIGKSTLVKKVCEKLVGDDGYIMLDIGRESGHDCIEGIVSETVRTWEELTDVIDDIVENRSTDYKDLKVVVFDTLDEMFTLSDNEAIRQHNLDHPDKRVDTINSVAGGFGKGLDKSIDLVLEQLFALKEVGVSFIVILHTKNKDIEDAITGQTYQTITANMPQRYFNAIKSKLDFLGVAYIDREIIKEKLNRKDPVTKKDITRNKVVDESRKIAFRSDEYNLDSKSRFESIVSDIPLDADEFIKAIEDAIKTEQSKSEKSFEKTQEEQEKKEIEKLKEIAKKEKVNKEKKELDTKKELIKNYIVENKGNLKAIKPLTSMAKELGYSTPLEVDNIKDVDKLIELIS